MAQYVLASYTGEQARIANNVMLNLFDFKVRKLSKNAFLVDGDAKADLEERCLLSGLKMYELVDQGDPKELLKIYSPKHLRGSNTKLSKQLRRKLRAVTVKDELFMFCCDDDSYIAQPSHNESAINELGRFMNNFYGNTFFMGRMMYLHQDFFNVEITNHVDLFMGGAGSVMAGIKKGTKEIIAIEYNKDNYENSKANILNFLGDTEYELKNTFDEAEFTLEGQHIHIFHANSLVDGPAIIKQSGLENVDVVTDMPWGFNKCEAYSGEERIKSHYDFLDMHERLSETLSELPTNRISVAHNNHVTLSKLVQVNRIVTPSVYDIAMYEQSK